MKASVYIIQAGDEGPVKIGWAVDPQLRLRALQTANFLPLRLLVAEEFRSVDAARAIEADLHLEFKEYRLHGEWFSLESRLKSAVSRFCQGFTMLTPRGDGPTVSVSHIAGFAVRIGRKARQLCAWCGERLIDDDYGRLAFSPGSDPEPKFFEIDSLVEVTISGSARGTIVIPSPDHKMPSNCCANQPRCSVCDHLLLNHDQRGCYVLRCECVEGHAQ